MAQIRVDHLGNRRVTDLGDVRVWSFGEDLAEAVTVDETFSGDTVAISDVVAETFTAIDSFQTATDFAGSVSESFSAPETFTGDAPGFSGLVAETAAVIDTISGGINAISAIIESVVIRDGYISPDDLGGSPNSPIVELPALWIQEVALRGRSVRPFV